MLRRVFSVVGVALVCAASTAPAFASSGPAGHWTLNEGRGTTVADSSGHGNDGVLSGGATWATGHSGTALSFDGSTGQVRVPNSASLEPATVTVSAWVKQDGSPGSFRYIVAKGATGCIAASYGLYTGPDGGLQFYVSQARGTTYARSPDAGTGVWDGGWHDVVGSYDGSTIRLYVDGVQIGSGTSYPGALEYLLHDSNDLFIGNYPGCADHEFLGTIDNVVVWNRALSPSDIAALRSSQDGAPASPPSTPPTQGGTAGQPGSGAGATPAPPAKDDTPEIARLRLSTATFTIDARGRLVSSPGTSITYTESQAARLTVTLLRSETGVRRGKRCLSPKGRKRPRQQRCSRFVVISSFVHQDRAGKITLDVDKLLRRRLQPGAYRLDVTPRAHGKVGRTVSVKFVVRQRRAKHH
jgi:hypothetical protein